ncbi:MAG: porin family protein [Bacteroidota bacterium]
MKRLSLLVLSTLALFAFQLHASAQQRLGIRAGINFANIALEQSDQSPLASPDLRTTALPGLIIGGALEVGLGRHLALQVEPQYIQKGARIVTPVDSSEIVSTLRLSYIELPILLKGTVKVRKVSAYAFFGPSFSYNIEAIYRATDKDSTTERSMQYSFKPTDIALDFGAGIGVDLSPNVTFVTDFRYSLGLVDTRISHEAYDSNYQKSSDMKVVVGLLFGL